MGKKVWYEIKIKNVHTGEETLVAKVKSVGLANIVYKTIEELYKKNRDWYVM